MARSHPPRITPVGAGAIGSMLASRPQRSGVPLDLLVRPHQVGRLRSDGLRVRDHDRTVHTTQGLGQRAGTGIRASHRLSHLAPFAAAGDGPATVSFTQDDT
jgi:ketopantoate reductase